MKGDYGVIHVEVSHDLTHEEAERLSDDIAKVVFNRRWRKKDIGMHAHWDGDCEVSPHCYGAFQRRAACDHQWSERHPEGMAPYRECRECGADEDL